MYIGRLLRLWSDAATMSCRRVAGVLTRGARESPPSNPGPRMKLEANENSGGGSPKSFQSCLDNAPWRCPHA